jgi:hypothetical protein
MGFFSRRKSKQTQPLTKNGFLHSTPTSKGSSRDGTMNEPTIPADIPLPRAPDPDTNPVAYLRSIHAVRERSRLVLDKAKRNQLKHFDVDMGKFRDTASYVVSIIKVCTQYFYLRNCQAYPPSIARFPRSRILHNSSSWQMAALRCRRPPTCSATHGLVAGVSG